MPISAAEAEEKSAEVSRIEKKGEQSESQTSTEKTVLVNKVIRIYIASRPGFLHRFPFGR